MSWKKIALELVPPLEGEAAREPWTRKEKLKALTDKSLQLFHKILRKMTNEELTSDFETYLIPHTERDHPNYFDEGLIEKTFGGYYVPDRAALQERHDMDDAHGDTSGSLVPINTHAHEGEDVLTSPTWKEYGEVHRAIKQLKREIPKDVK